MKGASNIETKITFLQKTFANYDYDLNTSDIKDLEKRLISKPMQLYLLGIEFLKKRKAKVNYKNLSNLIILDIRIRDNIKKVITALEEAIWVQYIDHEMKFNNVQEFKNACYKRATLYDIIERFKKQELHPIREIRNDVNHIVYPILFGKFQEMIKRIEILKKIDFVENKIIDDLLFKILKVNNYIKLKCVANLFKNIKRK